MTLLEDAREHLNALSLANDRFSRNYPGDSALRQPVHTVYGGAHLFRASTPRKLGDLALSSLKAYAPTALDFALAVGFVPPEPLEGLSAARLEHDYTASPEALRAAKPEQWLAARVYERVCKKLEVEPVEDYRIDFEDGFGARSDAEEDAVACSAATQVAIGSREHSLPRSIGIRIKTLTDEWQDRATQTLDLFVGTLLTQSTGKLPNNFVVTLPKVTIREQPLTLVRLLEQLEARHGLPQQSIKIELMIEAPQALIAFDGRTPLLEFVEACHGRCVGVHLGTYDLTASCNITAADQSMLHPLCDLAKGLMTLAYAGTGVHLSDGATNILPVGPHRGERLSDAQSQENTRGVHAAWRLAHRHTTHSLRGGFYQGWDLHPAQLPVRYASCYTFFLQQLQSSSERLRHFIDKAAQASLVGDVFDDAATGQGLLNMFIRARNCGAIDDQEIAQIGLTEKEFALRSFAEILASRRARLASPTGS